MNHKRPSTLRDFNSNQARKLAIAVLNAADLPPDGSPDPDIDEPMQPGGNGWQAIVHLARQLVKSAPATPGERPKQRVVVTVQGGVAEVCEDTVPRDVEVEILDFDNLAEDAESEICRWSPELKDYWLMNHRAWGRCEANCPCKKCRGECQSHKDAL